MANTLPVVLDPKTWLSSLDDAWTLKQVCMPGAHDAGMYETSQVWAAGLALTQGESIGKQLERGIRYFDLRPQHWSKNKGDDRFYLHHGAATGPLLTAVLKDVVNFLGTGTSASKETIILAFSHHKDFTPGAKADYVALLQKHLGAYTLPQSSLTGTKKLIEQPLSKLRGKVLILLDLTDDEIKDLITTPKRTGYYRSGQDLGIYDEYANTKFYETMVVDQLKKFGTFSDANSLFLLNWTLTPDDDAWGKLRAGTRTYTDVKTYAEQINPRLTSYGHARDFLFQPNYHGQIVNIINGDFWNLTGHDVLAVCREVMQGRIEYQKPATIQLTSKATGRCLDMASIDTVGTNPPNGGFFQKWYKKPAGGNEYRLQNVATGLYLRASSDGFFRAATAWSGLFDHNNHLVGSLEESSEADLRWHFEPVEGARYHIVAAGRKAAKTKEDRLDGHGEKVFLHSPNDGDFQIWIESAG